MKKAFVLMLLSTLGLSQAVWAASSEAKVTYSAAKDTAASDYKVATAKCDSLVDNPKAVCMAEAKAARVAVEANAKAQYKGTLRSRTAARKEIAEANYKIAKAKCDAVVGNAKDVCIKEAKSVRVASEADAKADKEVIQARSKANEDKLDAEYKVALEKCDALVSEAKDTCVAAAKKHFKK